MVGVDQDLLVFLDGCLDVAGYLRLARLLVKRPQVRRAGGRARAERVRAEKNDPRRG